MVRMPLFPGTTSRRGLAGGWQFFNLRGWVCGTEHSSGHQRDYYIRCLLLIQLRLCFARPRTFHRPHPARLLARRRSFPSGLVLSSQVSTRRAVVAPYVQCVCGVEVTSDSSSITNNSFDNHSCCRGYRIFSSSCCAFTFWQIVVPAGG
jgi:hypothetical protein